MTRGRGHNRRDFMLAGAASLLAPSMLLAAARTLDVAYVNARIWTGAPGGRIATALGTVGDKIVALDNGPVRQLVGKRTEVVDLHGAFVVPGFIDAHTRFLIAAAALTPPDPRQFKVPAPTEAMLEKNLRDGIALGLRHGVTQTHAMGLDWTMHDALLRLRAKGETGMRFYSYVPLQDWEKLDAIVTRDGRGDEWVRWGGLKALSDGSPDLRDLVTRADGRGLQVAVHAVGDEANDAALDLFATVASVNGRRDRRFRIEHAQHLTPSAIARFAKQNVTASMQPYHAIDGSKRPKGTYAFKSLIDAGARVSFGSDWPVAPVNPLAGMAAAVLRQSTDGATPNGWMPEQRITVEQALTAYTSANAYAGFQEHSLGRLAPGFMADFVVLDSDLLLIDAHKLVDVRVLRTVVGGKERFAAS